MAVCENKSVLKPTLNNLSLPVYIKVEMEETSLIHSGRRATKGGILWVQDVNSRKKGQNGVIFTATDPFVIFLSSDKIREQTFHFTKGAPTSIPRRKLKLFGNLAFKLRGGPSQNQ